MTEVADKIDLSMADAALAMRITPKCCFASSPSRSGASPRRRRDHGLAPHRSGVGLGSPRHLLAQASHMLARNELASPTERPIDRLDALDPDPDAEDDDPDTDHDRREPD